MYPTLVDLIRAGAIATLCKFHQKIGGKDDQWDKVREYTGREFREVDSAILDQLVEKAKQARCAADAFRVLDKKCTLDACEIPSMEI